MADLTVSGSVKVTITNSKTKAVDPASGTHDFPAVAPAAFRANNVKLVQGLLAIAQGTMYGPEFNPGADTKNTFTLRLASHAVCSDGENVSKLDATFYDLDNIDVANIKTLFEAMKA